ncbi:PLPL1 protein, partial [Bucco capensis]|nr:PLPL1 protein [Bucco capensis]
PFSILVRGCGYLIIYEAGVLDALKDWCPGLLKSAARVYGASSGSIMATVALCECDTDAMKRSIYKTVENTFWPCVYGKKLSKIIKDTLNEYLPPNAHELVSGKLHVIITRLRDCRSVAVSHFDSKEDLIQAILCSCYVPLYSGFLPPVYHGVRYVDGEIGMWRANFVSQSTITISSFAGEYDICPREVPAAFFSFQILDCVFHLSKRNISRFLH